MGESVAAAPGSAGLTAALIDEIRRDAIAVLRQEANNINANVPDRIRAAELLLRLTFDFAMPDAAKSGHPTNLL